MRFAVAIIGLCATLAILTLGAVTSNHPATAAPPVALKSNIELLGEVKTVMDPNDPLYRELAEDDRFRGRDRDHWSVAVGDR